MGRRKRHIERGKVAGNGYGKRTGEERRECKREIENAENEGNEERRDRGQEKTGGEKKGGEIEMTDEGGGRIRQ